MRNLISHSPRGHLAQLVFLASATAATAAIITVGDSSLSLSNFQLIADLSVPLGCLLAYNIPISGCDTADFDSRRTCSVQCTRGLAKKQSTLQQTCQSVQVQSNTAQHYDGSTASDHRRPAAAIITAAAATTTAAAIFHFGRPTSAATNHNINTNTGSASPSATCADYSSTADKHSRTARAATAAAAASGHKYRYLCNDDPD
ncbi:hypothetical protein LX32DRAFT_689548 [Colletotrichum zoysiae]|uniref:Uncharacterized protein n=1 Tax=Colletotrichum zoysiae TaxID=1216348 RepID=A0AAD9M5L5_9PEZI|nr:hypothetical protein LX32DRAFT_689548 [Colletotrichum zoysiae]